MYRLKILTLLLAAVVLAACAQAPASPVPSPTPSQPADGGQAAPNQAAPGAAEPEAEIHRVVEEFGKRLQMVSLLSPSAAQDLQEQYAEFVSPALLETWMGDVAKAPGRMVSSPWPERIEITDVKADGPDRYRVTGNVVEVTSSEAASGGAAARIPVRMVVQKTGERWVIVEYAEER